MKGSSGSAFFDTSILVYTITQNDPRAETAERLLAGGGTVAVQVLNEFVDVARRKMKMSVSDVSFVLDGIRSLCGPVKPMTVATHETALKIATRYGYRIYDALILASALEAGCDVLYSEDMQNGQNIGGLTIRNPFLQ